MATALFAVSIRSEEDVVAARRAARDAAALLGFDANDQTRIATALSEIARNAFRYAGGGTAEFALRHDGSPEFEIVVADRGDGIADLKRILAGSYKSKTGMGMGIVGARRLMDRFAIDSEPGRGTRVTLAKRLPPAAPKPTPQRLARIAAECAVQPADALDEMRRQNQETLRVLDELRARQQELTDLNAEMEATNRGVVALYAELEDRAERLRRADQMKSRFLSHMSHEFRTPLTSIMALSRLLADETDGSLSAEQKKQVGFIRRSAENLLEMVNDLLDLARVEAGKAVVRPAGFNVIDLFSALRSVLRPLHVNEDVELVIEDPSGIPPLYTDEAKVAQILRNFVSNALKFTERGEVRLSVQWEPEAGMATFVVRDTGIGIAPDHLELIFQEFSQVDMPLQSKFRGSGLGLPLSKGLAEVLGGSVWVESRVGEGSTFYARIPAVYRAQESEEIEQPRETVDFLLVDDEEVARYLVRQSLPGSVLAEAPDGPSGIEAARRLQPHAVLLDLRMPGMNGFEVLKALASDEATRRIPVVVMTGKALTPEERGQLAQYATAVLSKEVLSLPDAGTRIREAAAGVRR